jgi:hypothetical protein
MQVVGEGVSMISGVGADTAPQPPDDAGFISVVLVLEPLGLPPFPP